jgi:adenine/guanine phosphoribosyltransferase-like PRPP-binding protein
VLGCAFVIELGFLEGRKKIEPLPSFSLVRY